VSCIISFRQYARVVLGIGLILIMGCSAKSTQTAIVSPIVITVPSPILVDIKEGFRWPDGDLPVRFQQYWTLRKAGNAIAAFDYEAPHVREMVIRGRYEKFSKDTRTDWLSIRVEKINRITEDLLEIDFNMVATNKDKEGAKRNIFFRDSWLIFSGQWFHVLKDPFVTGDGIGK